MKKRLNLKTKRPIYFLINTKKHENALLKKIAIIVKGYFCGDDFSFINL